MARKSGWQQFSDNFNSVYGTFNKVGQDIETAQIMDDTKFTGEGGLGAGLKGSALERARYKALGDIYTKWGNAEQGMAVRGQLADLEAKERDNTINQSIMKELIAQKGYLASQNMSADTNNLNASAANSRANAYRTTTLTPIDAQLQGLRVDREKLGLDFDGQTLASRVDSMRAQGDINRSNANVSMGTEVSRIDLALAKLNLTKAQVDEVTSLLGGKVKLQGAQLKSALAGAGLTEAQADAVVIANENKRATQETDNSLAIINNMVGTNVAKAALETSSENDRIFAQLALGDYENQEQADQAALSAIRASSLPPEEQERLTLAIQRMGLGALVNEGAKFTQEGLNAISKGLKSALEFYEGVDNDDTLTTERDEDGTIRIMSTETGAKPTVLFSATGDDAEMQILGKMAAQVYKPAEAFSVVTAQANLKHLRANIKTEEFRAELVNKQAEKLQQELNSAGGLGERRKIALKGLADFMKSESYILLGEMDGGTEMQQDMVGNFMRVMGMSGAPPVGVPGSLWANMTDKDKEEFINAGEPTNLGGGPPLPTSNQGLSFQGGGEKAPTVRGYPYGSK